jgi:hypothetical protein
MPIAFAIVFVFYCAVWCFTLHHWRGTIIAPIRAAVRNVRFPAAAFFSAPAGAMLAGAVHLELMDQPVRVISTVQVGITAIGILIGAVGQPLVVDLLGGAIPEWLG